MKPNNISNIVTSKAVIMPLFFILLCLGVSAIGTYPSIDPSMVLYYHFNNDSSVGENDTIVHDYSNNSNNATGNDDCISDCINYNSTYGIMNTGSFIFNGLNRNFTIPDKSSLDFVQDKNYTINVWIKPTNHNTQVILGKNFGGWGPGYGIRVGNTIGCWQGYGGTTSYQLGGGYIKLNEWQMITCVRNGTNLLVYQNGILMNNYSNSLINSDLSTTGTITIASRFAQEIYNGTMDELVIYNRSLSSNEIYINYELYYSQMFKNYNDFSYLDNINIIKTSKSYLFFDSNSYGYVGDDGINFNNESFSIMVNFKKNGDVSGITSSSTEYIYQKAGYIDFYLLYGGCTPTTRLNYINYNGTIPGNVFCNNQWNTLSYIFNKTSQTDLNVLNTGTSGGGITRKNITTQQYNISNSYLYLGTDNTGSKLANASIGGILMFNTTLDFILNDYFLRSIIDKNGQPISIRYFHKITPENENCSFYSIGNWTGFNETLMCNTATPYSTLKYILDYMNETGVKTITTQQLIDWIDGKINISNKSIILHFDDGWQDTYTVAYPLIKKYGYVGEVAVNNPPEGVSTVSKMNWTEVIELYAEGWGIVSHTVNHPYMNSSSEEDQILEWNNSIYLIYNHTGYYPTGAVYPSNYRDDKTDMICRRFFRLCYGGATQKLSFKTDSMVNNGFKRFGTHWSDYTNLTLQHQTCPSCFDNNLVSQLDLNESSGNILNDKVTGKQIRLYNPIWRNPNYVSFYNRNLTNSTILELYGLKNAWLINETRKRTNISGDINITILSNTTAYIFNNYAININNTDADPFWDGRVKLSNPFNDTITIPLIGLTNAWIFNISYLHKTVSGDINVTLEPYDFVYIFNNYNITPNYYTKVADYYDLIYVGYRTIRNPFDDAIKVRLYNLSNAIIFNATNILSTMHGNISLNDGEFNVTLEPDQYYYFYNEFYISINATKVNFPLWNANNKVLTNTFDIILSLPFVGYSYYTIGNQYRNVPLNRTLYYNGTDICKGSSIDITRNLNNVNITLNQNELCYVLDNYSYNYSVGNYRLNDPYWNVSGDNSVLRNIFNFSSDVQITKITYPYNDIYDNVLKQIIATNKASYSLTINPGEEFIIGDYTLNSLSVVAHESCGNIFSIISDAFGLATVIFIILVAGSIITLLQFTGNSVDFKDMIIILLVSSVMTLIGYVVLAKINGAIC